MKIVVLDGYALNPGDLSWQALEENGDVTIYERTSYTDEAEIVARIGNAEMILTNKVPITAEILTKTPKLRYIGVMATGYNIIDLTAAAQHQIVVTNIPAYSTDAVAQFTFALLLELTSHVGLHNQLVHEGEWTHSPDFTFWRAPLVELSGKTLGLVGYGKIAQKVAEIGHALGMEILYTNHRPKAPQAEWAQQVSDLELYKRADVISLHVPQTPETTKIINQEALAQMKTTALLVNTARGGLVDEAALAKALTEKRLAGAAVDVVSSEPITADNPLLQAPNCIITPHIAWAPVETRQRLMDIAVANVQQFLAGSPQNQVGGKA